MRIAKTIIVNDQILALIQSKYPVFNGICPHNFETRYYARLLYDTNMAKNTLRHRRLAALLKEVQNHESGPKL